MINILLTSLALVLVAIAIAKTVDKLFAASQLDEEFKDIIQEVDRSPLFPKEAELAVPHTPKDPEVYIPEPTKKPVSRNPGKPRKRTRKSKLNV
jgi:hypothetical protein